MKAFNFYCPTRIVFGGGQSKSVGQWLKQSRFTKVCLVYGGASAEKNGTIKKVTDSLTKAGLSFMKIGGVRSNPTLSFALDVCEAARGFGADVLLAVGGGSVIDTCKAASAAYYANTDPWAFFTQGVPITRALPVACVLTLPAAGSEQSVRMVINHADRKLGCASEAIRPVLSVLDPELFFTLPRYQIGCGVVDMMSHIMERYFSNTDNIEFTSVQAQAVLRLAMRRGQELIQNPQNEAAWGDIALIGAWAHNGYYGLGHEEDWACHAIEHELSALDPSIAHGAALACLIPAWMQTVLSENPARIERFCQEVLGFESAQEGIGALKDFYRSLGMPQSLKEFGLSLSDLDECAQRLCPGSIRVGHYVHLDREKVLAIYRLAYTGEIATDLH